MTRRTLSALAVARPLLEGLTNQAFSGRVWGVFEQACNLIDDRGRIIALVLPAVGQGPFSISVPGSPGIFEPFLANQPAWANREAVVIGPWRIELTDAAIWEPQIDRPEKPLKLNLIANILEPYANWPNLAEETPLAQRLLRLARQLIKAINQPDKLEQLSQAVAKLAGLGPGLTPAGDDYMIGAMAALWLTGHPEMMELIAATAIPRTNALSAAFLRAAARGEFMEPWHALAEAWQAEDEQAAVTAVTRIAAFGASSGADALAGFTHTLAVPAQLAIASDK
jgi:hypothetical protein